MMVHIYRRLVLLGLFITLITTTHAQLQSVTYTITDVNSVNITAGQAPLHSQASYSQTGSTVGKMAAEEQTYLVLNGYEGYTIKKVVLSMRSNASAGAGSLDVRVADRRICQIRTGTAFRYWWKGGFYSTTFLNVTPTMRDTLFEVKEGQNVTILMQASKNNLYIASYTLYYEKVVYPSYKVTYSVNGDNTTIDSNKPFAEILPLSVQNPITASDKVFIGWAGTKTPDFPDDFIDLSQRPVSDTTIYAIFGKVDYQDETVLMSLLASSPDDSWLYSSTEDQNLFDCFYITSNAYIQSPPIYIPAVTTVMAEVGFRNFNGSVMPFYVNDEYGNNLLTYDILASNSDLYSLSVLSPSSLSYGRLCFQVNPEIEGMNELSSMACTKLYIYLLLSDKLD